MLPGLDKVKYALAEMNAAFDAALADYNNRMTMLIEENNKLK